MYNYDTVVRGITKFIDTELVPKMHGLQKWLFGTGAGIMASKSHNIFESLKQIEFLHTLEIIEGDKVNVECIYKEMIKQANQGPIDIELPMLGTVTLDKTDVEKMYRYILED